MQKYVNGILVDLTPEEIAAREAEELAESLRDRRPVATGKSLVSTIEKSFIGQPFELRVHLQNIFLPIKNTLLSETCTILSVDDFNAVLTMVSVNSNLDDTQKTLFTQLANSWALGVKFE